MVDARGLLCRCPLSWTTIDPDASLGVAWDLVSPALNCELRHKPRPAALTDEQIRMIVGPKNKMQLTQIQIVERVRCNQSTVQRALRKADTLGMVNEGLKT